MGIYCIPSAYVTSKVQCVLNVCMLYIVHAFFLWKVSSGSRLIYVRMDLWCALIGILLMTLKKTASWCTEEHVCAVLFKLSVIVSWAMNVLGSVKSRVFLDIEQTSSGKQATKWEFSALRF